MVKLAPSAAAAVMSPMVRANWMFLRWRGRALWRTLRLTTTLPSRLTIDSGWARSKSTSRLVSWPSSTVTGLRSTLISPLPLGSTTVIWLGAIVPGRRTSFIVAGSVSMTSLSKL